MAYYKVVSQHLSRGAEENSMEIFGQDSQV
jgi:hypothetical protein